MTKLQASDLCLRRSFSLILAAPEGSDQQRHSFARLLRYTQTLLPKHQAIAVNLTLAAVCGCDRRQSQINSRNLQKFLQKNLTGTETLENINPHKLQGLYSAWVIRIYRNKTKDIYRQQPTDISLHHQWHSEATPLIDQLADQNPEPMAQLLQIHQQQRTMSLQDYLLCDPDGLLKNCHPRNYPHCNAHALIAHRILASNPTPWHELAAEYDIAYGTVTAFYNRKVLPLLRAIVADHFPDLEAYSHSD